MSDEAVVEIVQCADALKRLEERAGTTAEQYAIFKRIESIQAQDTNECEMLLSNRIVSDLRPILSKKYLECVYNMELEWADKLLIKPSRNSIKQYPKYTDYSFRVAMELSAAYGWAGQSLKRILFAGCGPLPLSAILAATEHSCEVIAVDRSKEAIAAADKLIHALRVHDRISLVHSTIESFSDFKSTDIVMLAQSVTADPQSCSAILEHVRSHLPPKSIVVIKPPHLLERLLLPEIDVTPLRGMNQMQATFETGDDFMTRLLFRA